MSEEKIYTNKRLIVSEILIWLAACLLIYIGFVHIKGVTGLEKTILFLFLLLVMIWRGSKLLQVFPVIILSEAGLTYRTDFKTWDEIEKIELIPGKFGLAFTQKLHLTTSIKGREEVIWNITAVDSQLDLEQLLVRINTYRQFTSTETLEFN